MSIIMLRPLGIEYPHVAEKLLADNILNNDIILLEKQLMSFVKT